MQTNVFLLFNLRNEGKNSLFGRAAPLLHQKEAAEVVQHLVR